MFGGSKSTFGQAQPTQPFGFTNSQQTASPFAQSAFGKPATTTFGQPTSAFGQQPNTSSVFGTPQQPAGLFGSAATPAFGATPTTQSSFGGFGQPQQQNNSIFGAQNASPSTSSLFGANNTGFGAAKPSSFGFAPAQPSTSLFGQSSAAQPQTGGMFGQNANTSGGLFGANNTGFGNTSMATGIGAQMGGQNGSATVQYQPTLSTDTLLKGGQSSTVNTKQHCLTFMKEYEQKSIEELRLEDYMANRKGPQAGTSSSGMFNAQPQQQTGMFGSPVQPTNSGGLFGQAVPAQSSTGLFGSTTNTMGNSSFGQPANTGFGANTSGGGLFGKPFNATTPATSAAPSFGAFGANNSTSPFATKPFGAPAVVPATGLFGQQPQQSTFGQPTSAFGSTFGQTSQAQPTSLFGSAQTAVSAAPSFGLGAPAQPSSAFGSFGATQPAQGGIFGAQKPLSGFGVPAQPATSTAFGFGQNTGTSLFNNTMNKPAAPVFSGFGTQPAAPLGGNLGFGQNSTSLFGNNAAKPGGMFGSTTPSTGGMFGNTQPFGTNTSLNLGGGAFGQPQLGAPTAAPTGSIHQHILSLASNPYGDNPIFKDLKPNIGVSEDSLKATNPAAQKAILESSSQFKISPHSASKTLKVKPIGSAVSKKTLFDGLEEYDSSLEHSFSLKINAKRLIIKPKASPSVATGNSSFRDDSLAANANNNSLEKENEPINLNKESFNNEIPLHQSDNQVDNGRRVSWLQTNSLNRFRRTEPVSMDNTIKELMTKDKNDNPSVSAEKTPPPTISTRFQGGSLANESFLSPYGMDETQNEADLSLLDVEPHPTGIVLRRPGYYTIPNLDELNEYLDEEGTCVVPNFTIGRKGYGNVYFSESMDVAGMNLDEIVIFRHKEVILYPDEDNKPPVGTGLNRKAQVTLDQVWPHDKTLHQPIKDSVRLEAMDYESKLRRICDKHDTRFLEYRPDTGSCVFKVEHFSKYTLSDSDEEDQAPTDPKKAKLGQNLLKPGQKPQMDQSKDVHVIKAPSQINQQSSQMLLGQRSAFDPFYQDDDLEISEYTREAPTSPSMSLAMEMRTDSHKLQLMKASFFVEDDCDTRSVASDDRDTPDQTVPSGRTILGHRFLLPSSRSVASDSLSGYGDFQERDQIMEIEEKRAEILPTKILKPIGPKSMPLIIRPKVTQFNLSELAIPIKDSILHKMIPVKGNNLTFFSGRKFRNGWSSKNCFTILNTVNTIEESEGALDPALIYNGREPNDGTTSIIQIVQIKSMQSESDSSFAKSIEEHLNIELKHDKRHQVEDSDCPFLEATGGTFGLNEHFLLAKKLSLEIDNDQEKYNETVWTLINALWGYREELEHEEPTAHTTIMFRRDLFSEWIENVVTDKDALKKNKDYLDQLLSLILCHKVSDACELAFINDDVNLAMLLSQISGGPAVRQLLQHQLSSWQEVQADKFISKKRLKALMVVAGVSALASQHGPINIFEQLDWIKSLALQLWYLCSPTASVTDALIAYERSFEIDEMNVEMPHPPYISQYKSTKKHQDLRYHLLKLFSVRSHPMEKLLHPANSTPDICDFRSSWLLLQQLETLGYRHCSELCKAKIYTSFAEQLENHKMWHWSIFVLLHIPQQAQRELCVQNLLYRYIRIDGEFYDDPGYSLKEQFVVEQLQVPIKWVYWAKAVRAGSINNHQVQAKYLLRARQWSLAHEVILRHIAPDAIINDNIDYLKSLLEQFEDTRKVSNWALQGQILLDYIELNEKFENLQESGENLMEEDVELILERLKQKLSDLCSVIKQFPCPTSKHRLCQNEISQRLAFIIRCFYANTQTNSSCALMRIAMDKLPLSQEYAQQELRHVLTSFLKEKLTIN